ncbi:MAG: divergent polysaccharide deacetylase family protein [Deltaproteobacteria bacterium]|nr:divergent polysaccharide deacetylase family protein [Deltaproteobacteria bacterium]
MAGKKPARKKKGGKTRYFRWFLCGLLLLSLAAAVFLGFLRPATVKTLSSRLAALTDKPATLFEEPMLPPAPSPPPLKSPPLPVKEARLSIVIDDMGYKDKVCTDLIALDLNLSFAFLPSGPNTKGQIDQAHRLKRDILLHLPMEPRDSKWSPGPGALSTSMSDRDIQTTVAMAIAAVPHAVGVNNHMGSRFTENRDSMLVCLTFLKQRHLFFLDSVTSADSVGYGMARQMALATARRDIFIDNSQTPEDIKTQLGNLIELAEKRGSAIGIGHPHQATLDALRQYQTELREKARLVGVSRLVK